MSASPSIRVTFYRVKENGAKIRLICNKVQEAFKQEKRLLIAVPHLQAAEYIDALLWRTPPESFLPHIIANTPTSEWIAITVQQQQNVNQAARLLNLCPIISPLYRDVQEVYDLFDETHREKMELSKQRLQVYQANGLIIHKED